MKFQVRGYYHPESAFATISEWEEVAKQFLELEKQGFDTRGGVIDDNHELVKLINQWFSYQLYIETQRYDLLTQKNVLDFIEDFVNHRVWQLRNEFGTYFYNDATDSSYLDNVKVAFFYSRGDMEPFVLLDSAIKSLSSNPFRSKSNSTLSRNPPPSLLMVNCNGPVFTRTLP